jgi:hypothetical protein
MANNPSFRVARSGKGVIGDGISSRQRFPRFAPFTLGISADGNGIRIYKGRLLHAVTVINFEVKYHEDEPFSVLASQDPIPGITAEVPAVMGNGEDGDQGEGRLSSWTDLGWFGDVFLQWTVDQESGEVSEVDIVGPAEPEGTPIPSLNSDLSRDGGEGASVGRYFVKIGSVSEEGEINQEVNSDVTYCTTLIPANPSSDSSESSSSSGGGSSSSSSGSSSGTSDSSSSSSSSSSDSSGGSSGGGSSDSSGDPSGTSDSSSSSSSDSSGGSGGSNGKDSSDDPDGSGGSGSSGSSGDSDGSGGGDGSDGSGSDKSSAIVPTSLSPTGHVALLTMEAPEILFFDVQRVTVKGRRTNYEISPIFIDVCEPGSIRVVSVTTDKPAMSGCRVSGSQAVIDLNYPMFQRPKVMDFMLCGTRKGFKGVRFPLRDKEQFDLNEKFINSAYPAKDFSKYNK